MAARFTGRYEHGIDAKGRIIIPAKFREGLGTEVVFVPDKKRGCILAYSQEEFDNFMDRIEEKQDQLSLAGENEKVQMLEESKFLINFMAKNAEQDNQGRILVPAEMKEEAEIEKTVLSVGNRNRIEIWNPDKANNYVLEKSMGKPDAFAVANSFGIRL